MSGTAIREELRSKWRSAAEIGSSDAEWRAVALSLSAPVRLLAGIREPDGNIALLIESPLSMAPRAMLRTQPSAVSLTDQRRNEEGLMRLAITLERNESTDVFQVLASDLAEVASSATSAQSAIAATVRRLEAWQACLRSHARGLSREEQIGLFGELTVLRQIAEEVGYSVAVSAWKGPFDGLHDFSHAGTALEVKSVLGTGQQVRISKLNQLESDGLAHLLVVRPRLREASDGQTILDLIAALREEISRSAPEARSDFDECLIRAGVQETSAESEHLVRAQIEGVTTYRVEDGFPRLTFASVPVGIVDGSYLIDERAFAAHLMDHAGLLSVVRSMAEAPHE